MSFFSDSYHLFIRWMKKLVRNPILVFFSLFQPIIFLVLFTQLFSKFGSLIGPGVSYTVFATAGIVLQNAYSCCCKDRVADSWADERAELAGDRKSTRLNSSHG